MDRARVAALAWKDILEFVRDRRSLGLMVVSAFLFPILGLMVTGLTEQQRVTVAILVCDHGDTAVKLARLLEEALRRLGWVSVELAQPGPHCSPHPGVAVTVAIPEGFTANATSLNRVAVVKLYRLVGSAAADAIAGIVENVVLEYSRSLAGARVATLAKMAGVNVSVEAVLSPLKLVSETVGEGGAPVPPGVARAAETARFLAFAVFFVLNPAAVAVADAVARERESGTGELLAVSPLTGSELVLGKALGSLAAVAVAGLLDMVAVIAYSWATLGLNTGLVLYHAVATMMAILVTMTLTLAATLLIPGRRASTLVTSIITGVAMIVFFSALFVDIERLPMWIRLPLYLVPYTYVVQGIKSYALGDAVAAAASLAGLAAAAVSLLVISARLYRPSRIVTRY